MTDARTTSGPGRHPAGPARTFRHETSTSGRKRWAAGALATAVAAGTLGVLAPPASAAISTFGPVDPASNFPSYYTDGNGLSLAMCEDGGTLCLSGPEKIQDVHATPGADAEAFYYVADAQTRNFVLHNALEAAYAGDGAGQEVVFMRSQVTARAGGLVAGATYKVTDPYGTFNCVAEAGGVISQNACRVETEPVAGEFGRALNGRIGPFLTRDPSAPPPPAGYLGALEDYTKVVGSPTGFNAFRVQGPNLVGTCTETDGTVIESCQQTDQFFLLGKIADTGVPSASVSQGALDFGDVPATPAVTKTLTYANTGTLPVTISSVALGGTNASAFAQTNNCPVAPAELAAGARCTIDVTFTPEAGTGSAATLTIDDNTPADVRTIALKGSNLPVMYVSDPVPPAGLAFGTVGVGSTSVEDNVVIGNSGNGPLTIPSTGISITGPSAAHYKLGPNNTCRTAVAPDGGCEIGVQFAPTSTGSKSANLRVSDSNGKVVNVPLTGTGGTQVLPGAPTGVTATAGNGSATVNWSAPTTTGTSAITGYSVRVFDGATQVGAARTAAATARSLPVTGLTNGTAYTFDVAAVNGSGTGAYSTRTTAVTPQAAVPGAPTGVTATAGDASATVRWTAPTSNGGATITGYSVRVFQGATQVGATRTVPATPTSLTVTGLTNGLAYTFDVAATNSAGTGAFSARSAAVTAAADAVPTVTARTPAVNATNVAVTTNVTATLSEAVQGVSGTTVFLRAAGSTTNVAATVTYNGTTRVATLDPTANLANSTQYTVTLDGGTAQIRDSANQPLADTTWTFTTAAVANPAPTVTGRAPAVNAVSVPVANNITATFSEGVTGVNTSSFAIRPAATPTSAPIAGTVTQNGTTNQWILNPTANLAADTRYTVTLTGGAGAIRDLQGAALTTTSWSFTTGPAPTVTARTPAVNAAGVGRTANVTATFSEGVQAVSGTTFTLRNNATGALITAVVSRNGTTNQWILNPGATLAASTVFRVNLVGGATGIRDIAGNPLANVQWTFTTGAA